ncbi:MAG: DUF3592 domain-containing protein [Myxococcota bacterium]|jgi:hypothetical protein
MQLAIPSAPRKASLTQVPGALVRVGLVAALALVLVAAFGFLGGVAARHLAKERDFLTAAVEVPGTIADVSLPPMDERRGGSAKVRVLYQFEGKSRTASGVTMDALEAEGVGPGAKVALLVDPSKPSAPRELHDAWRGESTLWLGQGGLGLGATVGLLLVLRELRRAVRRELEPLRTGALVWLTPDVPLPQTKGELRFPAHYFRDDVRHQVTARGRPGRAPVKNGEKILAAVVPSEPTWARIIDEDLARTLGWFRG